MDDIIPLFEGLVLDHARGTLLRDGEPVHLRPQTYEVLDYLVANRGRLLSHDEIIERVWQGRAVTDGSLGKCIEELRAALGDEARERLRNVRGRGYILEPLPQVPSAPRGRGRLAGLGLFVGLIALLVLAAALGRDWWRDRPADTPFRSLAVLPFASLGGSSSTDLELGMADTLIAKLGAAAPIVVRPIGAVRKYARSDEPLERSGRELAVDAVLGGSVQVVDGRIRVNARLIRVEDGRQIWAAQYDEAFGDIFTVQDTISQRVADELELGGEHRARLAKHDTVDPEAYLLYLQAQTLLSQPSPDTTAHAIELFGRAIAEDAGYAAAYDGLARSYVVQPISSDVATVEVQLPFMAAVSKALELDEELAEAHVSLARAKFWFEWDWEGAAREYERGIELNPNSALAHLSYAHLLSNEGRHQAALAEVDRALTIDPRSPGANTLKGQFLFQARRYEEGAEQVRAALELEPNLWIAWVVLGKLYERMGRYQEALEALAKAEELSSGVTEPLSIRGYVLAASGRTDEAREALRDLEALSAKRYVPPYNLALVHCGLGEIEEALMWLDRARAERDVRLVFLTVDPKWDVLRQHPRFVELVRRITGEAAVEASPD